MCLEPPVPSTGLEAAPRLNNDVSVPAAVGTAIFTPDAVEHVGTGQQYTTATMLRMEREIIGHMQEGNRRGYNDPTLVPAHIRVETEDRHRELNAGQRQAVEEVLLSRERIVGLDGIAGAGKTTTLAVVRKGAESAGYR
jgi:ABC-type glutathione transport system ATPase component